MRVQTSENRGKRQEQKWTVIYFHILSDWYTYGIWQMCGLGQDTRQKRFFHIFITVMARGTGSSLMSKSSLSDNVIIRHVLLEDQREAFHQVETVNSYTWCDNVRLS